MRVAERFLSTPSGWRATKSFHFGFLHLCISIHALRVEGDLQPQLVAVTPIVFLSTPSGWRATEDYAGNFGQAMISIHALRVEGDYIAVAV